MTFSCHKPTAIGAVSLSLVLALASGSTPAPTESSPRVLTSDCQPNSFRSADHRATIPAVCFQKAIWTANAIDRVQTTQTYEYIVVANAITLLFQANPSLSPQVAETEINAALKVFAKRLARRRNSSRIPTPYERVMTMYAALVPATTLAPRDIVTNQMSWARYGTLSGTSAALDEITQAGRDNSWQAIAPLAQASFSGLCDIASSNDSARIVADSFLSPIVQNPVQAPVSDIIAKNSHLQHDSAIMALAQEFNNGSAILELSTLVKMQKEHVALALTQFKNATSVMKTVADKQDDIYNYDPNSPEANDLRAYATPILDQAQEQATEVEAGSFVVGSLASLIDGKTGSQITSAGTGAANLVRVAATYAESAINIGDQVFNFATDVATGNMLGAIGGIFGFFDDGGPNPNDQDLQDIKQQLGQVQSQLSTMKADMDQRFDRIDAELGQLYGEMNMRFDRLETISLYSLGLVEQIRTELLGVEEKLGRFETNVYAYFQASEYARLNHAISYLDSPNPTPDGLDDQETTLEQWAVNDLTAPYAAGPPKRSYKDADLAQELSDFPIERNINYLSQYLTQGGLDLQELAPYPMGNYRDWITATNSYFHYIALSNPTVPLCTDRLAAMLATGTALRSELAPLAGAAPASLHQVFRGRPDPTNPLFPKLLSRYESFANQFASAAKSIETTVIANSVISHAFVAGYFSKRHSAGSYHLSEATSSAAVASRLDIWQVHPSPITISIIHPCDHVSPVTNSKVAFAPAYLFDSLDPIIELGIAVGHGHLDICYTDTYIVVGGGWHPSPPPPGCHHCPPEPPHYESVVDVTLTLHENYTAPDGSTLELSRRTGTAKGEIVVAEPSHIDIDYPISDYWLQDYLQILTAAPEQVDSQSVIRAAKLAHASADEPIANVQRSIIGTIATKPSQRHTFPSAVRQALANIDMAAAYKQLLADYAQIGLPTLVAENDRVHAALFGFSGLLDQNVIQADFLSKALPRHEDVIAEVNARSDEALNGFHSELVRFYAAPDEPQTELSVTIDQLTMLLTASRVAKESRACGRRQHAHSPG